LISPGSQRKCLIWSLDLEREGMATNVLDVIINILQHQVPVSQATNSTSIEDEQQLLCIMNEDCFTINSISIDEYKKKMKPNK